eukprot:14451518-Alexandrium_andersonii.AAC.1
MRTRVQRPQPRRPTTGRHRPRSGSNARDLRARRDRSRNDLQRIVVGRGLTAMRGRDSAVAVLRLRFCIRGSAVALLCLRFRGIAIL